MTRPDIVIENACIITGCGPVFSDGFVYIRDGHIEAVGSMSKKSETRNPKPETRRTVGRHRSQVSGPGSRVPVVNAGGRYVLPGFINSHMHLYSALARGMPVGRMKSFGQVLKNLWWKLDRALSLDDIHISATLGAVDALRSGVTTVFDHHASYGAISGSLETISDALAKVGIRASLCFEISDRNGRSARSDALKESGIWLETVQARVEQESSFPMRGMVGLHASMTLSNSTLDAARELMDIFDAGAHVHAAEGIEDIAITRKRFGSSPISRFAKMGILRPGTIAAHCVHVDANDLALLNRSGATVVHNPMSNLNNAVGIAPILEMARLRIPIAIGTDGMSAGVADDIRLASVLHKVGAKDAQAGGDTVRDALWKTAPLMASRAFGMDIGAIRPAATGDVIIIDAIPPTPVTSANAWWHVLFGALNAPVRTAIVGGRVRMRNFRIIGVDESEVAHEAQRLAASFWKRIR